MIMRDKEATRELRIPVRLLEDCYGKGNFDDAGDDIAQLAGTCFGKDLNIEFDFDASHSNPWFHDFVVRISGIDHEQAEHLRGILERRGLVA
ncbi:hypothetical protein ASD78_16090 [Lysobacter sp. Root667]|nr:hypothetical protein ASD78_16090 [Lysobacter sp. Root667]